MMCSIFESLAYNVRDTDDLLNPAGAAALTGMIYKATDGPLIAGRWAAALAAGVAGAKFGANLLGQSAPKFFR